MRIYKGLFEKQLLNKPDDIVELQHALILHIHSWFDICELCIHCLFLRISDKYKDTERERPRDKDGNVPKPFGFFEKFFNHEAI